MKEQGVFIPAEVGAVLEGLRHPLGFANMLGSVTLAVSGSRLDGPDATPIIRGLPESSAVDALRPAASAYPTDRIAAQGFRPTNVQRGSALGKIVVWGA